MSEQEIHSVVIATLDPQKALFIIAKDAITQDIIEIHYREKYATTVEYILRTLRKGFGWVEVERGEKDTINSTCTYSKPVRVNGRQNPIRVCAGPCAKEMHHQKCTRQVQRVCEYYKQNINNKIFVKFVQIEKIGAIRGL